MVSREHDWDVEVDCDGCHHATNSVRVDVSLRVNVFGSFDYENEFWKAFSELE